MNNGKRAGAHFGCGAHFVRPSPMCAVFSEHLHFSRIHKKWPEWCMQVAEAHTDSGQPENPPGYATDSRNIGSGNIGTGEHNYIGTVEHRYRGTY